MSRFPELRHGQFVRFLEAFCRPGTLKFRNNKWIGLTRQGRPFVVHVKHGSTREVPAAFGRGCSKGSGRFTRRILEMVP